ncbi:uncharacterized protein IL334_001182 [Kwoniella shivajii]|uniref:PIPK domain-containing protein n=1 Tax=Kwoniella shivajii TaxID=564305 RepID=A0ABZ1CUA4_9TREE|nr:hypothetical protein IL334_001182 [Kwoniella shivajii]
MLAPIKASASPTNVPSRLPDQPLPKDSLGVRPKSPPLPPRKYVSGLPPTYLRHLRGLLHQWLEQQIHATGNEALPTARHDPALDDERLWSEGQVECIEKAIWEGAVLPRSSQGRDRSGRGLLELDWREWTKGALRRKAIWKQAQASHRQTDDAEENLSKGSDPKVGKSEQSSWKGSIKDKDNESLGKGKSSIPGSPFPSTSSLTPLRSASRQSSFASSSRSTISESNPVTPLSSRKQGEVNECRDEGDEQRNEWCKIVSTLKGFKRYSINNRDEWEVVEDRFPQIDTIQRDVPGAFPQTSHYDCGTSDNQYHMTDSPSDSNFSNLGLPTPTSLPERSVLDSEILKPVFCLHFPSDSYKHGGSSSTLRLKRDNSLGKRSQSSLGSNSGNKSWWNGSGGRWSEMTIGPNLDSNSELQPEVDFMEGQFASPSMDSGVGTWRQSMVNATNRNRKGVLDSFRGSPETSSSIHEESADQSGVEADQSATEEFDEDRNSTWSGTQRGSSRNEKESLSVILSGGEDDIPRKEAEDGKIAVVGGTIVVRGVKKHQERKALEAILHLLIYTIQSMNIELELLDAFRIPREPDEPPLPFNIMHKTMHHPPALTGTRDSTDIHRNHSLKERKGENPKGFFRRLGKDTKHVWEGLLGKRRTSNSHEIPLPTSADDKIGLPSTPVTGMFLESHKVQISPSSVNLPKAGLPEKSHIPHPTERHIAILSKLESQSHSTTPGLIIPMPPLLLRVKEEDRVRQERARQEIHEEATYVVDGLPGKSPTLSRSSTLMNDSKPTDPLRGRALGYRLGGDVRAGLGALSSGIDTFEAWNKLQRLDTLFATGLEVILENGEREVYICERPTHSTFIYWDEEKDKTIEDILNDLKDEFSEDNMVCARPGCTASSNEHLRWWVHAGKKVALRVEKMDKQDMKYGQIAVWAKCRECQRVSEARDLKSIPKSYSWGKLLEALLYTHILHPPSLCEHADSTSYWLRSSSLVLSLSVDEVPILDTRLPKLQVGPNVAKRKGGKEQVITAMEGLVRKERGIAINHRLGEEINDFFDGMQKRLAALRSHLDEKGKTCDDKDSKLPPVPSKEKDETANSLSSLESNLLSTRNQLLDRLSSAPASEINDMRRSLADEVKSATSRLTDWLRKCSCDQVILNDIILPIPDYAREDDIFALPGSSVLVRVDEPASIIAYTLSSLEYFTELTNTARPAAPADDKEDGSISTSAIAHDTTATKEGQQSESSRNWSVEVKRRDTPRDILSLRTVTKKKSEAQLSQPPKPLLGLSLAPNEPSLELSLTQVEGKSQSSDRMGDLVKTITKAIAQDPILTKDSKTSTVKPSRTAGSDTDAMSGFLLEPRGMRRLMSDMEKSAPPSSFRPTTTRTVSDTSIKSSMPTLAHLTVPSSPQPLASDTNKEGWGSVTSSFSNLFNQLLKLGSDVGESIGSIRVKGTDRSLSSLMGPLGMMSTVDNALTSTDDRPHIQFNYTVGDRLKLGCTVYYASAFDKLRRRCAIDKSLIQSLSRTNAWEAQGGKSKAAFFMTHDKRYIVKELVSKWNVSDTHALLEIAPAYFEHLAGTHNKATSLAKIVGFYNVRIHDLQNGTKRQLDLLVMENLFYKQTISRTYDLKGIEGRKVPKNKNFTENEGKVDLLKAAEGTLFDNEWLDGLSRGFVLLQPHAKRILQEAISLDTRFLSNQSIMDYSLLIGLDEGKHELVIGLVDAIGSYNLFKTIESRGKMALKRGGDVTIIPPDQYRERFENALKHYFIACPDKWSKSRRSGGKRTVGLPSVL